jgi:predicted permease
VLNDIRFAFRVLRKNPAFAMVAVFTLAVGIGANAVIFCVARSLMFPSLPYREVAEILHIRQEHRVNGGFAASIPDFLDWKSQSRSFSQMAAISYGWSSISGGSYPEDVDTAYVSEGLFQLLGVAPLVGRLFLPEEYRASGERVMILAYGFWQRQFGGDSKVIGRQLTLDGEGYTVVGIMPRGFEDQFFTKAFLPLSARRDSIPRDRSNRRSGVFARLNPGVSLSQARQEMEVIAGRLAQSYPATNTEVSTIVESWRERITGRFRVMTALLMGAVVFVLLIACVNVANLLMARASLRQKEIAVRLALGAGRTHLARQLLTESLVLAMLGGSIGILLAFWAVPVINNLYSFPRPLVMDLVVLLSTAALAGSTALLFGSVPASLLTRLGIVEVLKDKMARPGGIRSHRLRNGLVVGEIVLSLVLLNCATLLIRSFQRYDSIEKGFNPRNVLSLAVNLYKDRYPRGEQVVDFGRDVLTQLQHVPGQESSAVATPVTLRTGRGGWGVTRPGWQADSASVPVIDTLAISSDFFRVMQIPLLRGRSFTPLECEQGEPLVILSEKLAQLLWPGEDPIGKPLKLDLAVSELPWLSVVGVARESRGHSFPSAGTQALGLYLPFGALRQGGGDFSRVGGNRDGRYVSLRFYIRTAGDPGKAVDTARSAVLDVDRQQPVYSVQTMEEKLYREGASRRTMAILVGMSAAVALLLAAVGTYGVMAYSVSERTAEIGLRMALGAQRRDALVLVLKQGVRLLMMALPLGLVGSLAVSSVLRSQLFGISPGDPLTLAAASLVLAGMALLACWVPARRAASIDPLVALRDE